jgi:hypothetical protein
MYKESFIKKITNDNGELLNSIVFISEDIAINLSKILSIVLKENSKKRNSNVSFTAGDDGPAGE